MKPVLVLHVPVLHQGYIRLFKKWSKKAQKLYILGPSLVSEFTYLEKEIRAIDPKTVAALIRALSLFADVEVLSKNDTRKLLGHEIITAREEISKLFIKTYLPEAKVRYSSVFLRWDESSVNSSKTPKGARVSSRPHDIHYMALAADEGENTSDWWRQVGAVVVKDGKVIAKVHNKHLPSEQMPYVEGDPRDFVEAGTKTELATALHCEQQVVAEAARTGQSLAGASLYVTVFPCPVCAKLVAYSGIRKCYYSGGHASLDGERVLRSKNVELIYVKKG